MTKYNITEKKEKEAAYRSLVSPMLMDELKEKILDVILIQKKYKDKNYSAKCLAEDLGTNTRYISAIVNVRFHCNYTSFVNKFRIEEAMALLVDRRYLNLNMEDISDMVGFVRSRRRRSSPRTRSRRPCARSTEASSSRRHCCVGFSPRARSSTSASTTAAFVRCSAIF